MRDRQTNTRREIVQYRVWIVRHQYLITQYLHTSFDVNFATYLGDYISFVGGHGVLIRIVGHCHKFRLLLMLFVNSNIICNLIIPSQNR